MFKYHKIVRLNFLTKIITVLFLISFSKSWGQTTIFSENMGNANVGTLSIATNTFQNSGVLTYAGTADTRTSTPSSGYTTSCGGASGLRNVFFTTSGTASFEISGINTSACSNFTLSYGIHKNTNASNGSEFVISVSTDGTTYTALAAPTLSTGTGTATWFLKSITAGIPSTSNLRIRFVNTSTGTQFRLDDLCLQGNCCTSPTTTITPTSQTVCAGSVSTISVSSSATSPSYTWQASSTAGGTYSNVVNGTPSGASYSGINSSVLTFTAGSSTYYYRALVTESGTCTATSGTVTVVAYSNPSITTHPANQTICSGANASFSVTASGTSITYQWQVNTGSGFTNIANGALYSNVTTSVLTITGATTGMNGYLYQCVISPASPCASTIISNAATLNVLSGGTPTIHASNLTTSQIACNGFKLSWVNGDGSNRLVVVSTAAISGTPVNGTSYSANTTYGSGGTIAANQYVVYNGTGNSVYVTGLSATTTYYYKIFEFNNCSGSTSYLTSGTVPSGTVTTTSCSSAAGITAVYIDACAGACGFEGNNELIWGTTGSYAMKVETNGPTLHYNTTSPPTTTYISTYTANSNNINTLNAAVGSCTNTVFVDPNTQGYIPPNTNFLIANNCMCSPSAYDFSGLCNAGPIYVVFGTDAAWPCNSTGGIFGNKNCSGTGVDPRFFDLDFTAWGVSTNPIYSYTPCALTGGTDGDIITLDPAGGPATSYTNSGCAVPNLVLPIELLDFYGIQNGTSNFLNWKVASQQNVSQYIIEKSENAVDFIELARINAYGSEASILLYSCEDSSPFPGITYYKLRTLENDNSIIDHKIIDLNRENKEWKSIVYQENDDLILEWKNYVPKEASVSLFDLSGKLLAEENILQGQTRINTSNLATGIYFMRVSTPYKTENIKFVIQKITIR